MVLPIFTPAGARLTAVSMGRAPGSNFMHMNRICVAFCGLGFLISVGCERKQQTQMNAPPQGYAPESPASSDYYAYHNDQGMMADMSIADIHFIPHSSDLSGTGVARLERYAELLANSGGTLNYDTNLSDSMLIERRMSTAQTYLAKCMSNSKRVDIVLGMPGGPGMRAKESIAGQNIAQQPEERMRAYRLQERLTRFNSGSN